MAVLILKHNALTPYANFEGAKAGIVEKMNGAQQGELWAAEYFTSTEGDLNDVKGAILAFKGKNGIVTFADSDNVSEEMKTSLADYYTKTEIDELVENVTNNAIGIAEGDGIAIEGEGTIKTISANLDLNIVTVEGKEMLQLVDGSDNSKVIAEVDASAFVVDGMLSSAEIITVDDETELPEGVELSKGKYIKLSWNTDSGKSDTYVPVADLISEHKVVAGEDVAGEMVIVATNVVESTDENGVKVSTVNVTVDDSDVKSALDTKIGKDDIMLTFERNVEETIYLSTNEYVVKDCHNLWSLNFETTVDNCWVKITDEEEHTTFFDNTNVNTKSVKISCGDVMPGFVRCSYWDYDKEEEITENVVNDSLVKIKFVTPGLVKSTVNISEYKEAPANTIESFNYLNENKANATDVNTSLEVKADKFEVQTSIYEINTAIDTKIGKDDIMLGNKQVIILDDEENSHNGYTFEYLSDNWELSFKTYQDYNYDFITINVVEDQLIILTNEETKDKIKIVCNNGVISVYKDNELQPETGIFEPGKLVLGFGRAFVGEMTLQEGLPLNTKSSLEYLNENKADKNELESSIAEVESTFNADLGTKVGKYDTVLSVNDGETNTDYNVEGALEYLNNEIKAMSVIDCGVF